MVISDVLHDLLALWQNASSEKPDRLSYRSTSAHMSARPSLQHMRSHTSTGIITMQDRSD